MKLRTLPDLNQAGTKTNSAKFLVISKKKVNAFEKLPWHFMLESTATADMNKKTGNLF